MTVGLLYLATLLVLITTSVMATHYINAQREHQAALDALSREIKTIQAEQRKARALLKELATQHNSLVDMIAPPCSSPPARRPN